MTWEVKAAIARGNLNMFKAAPGSLHYFDQYHYDGQNDDSAKAVIIELYKFFATHPDANPQNRAALKDRFIDLTALLKEPFPAGYIEEKPLNKRIRSISFSLEQIRLAEALIRNHPHVIQVPHAATRSDSGYYVARQGVIEANTSFQDPLREDFQKLQSLKTQAQMGQSVTVLFLNSHAVGRFREVAAKVEAILQKEIQKEQRRQERLARGESECSFFDLFCCGKRRDYTTIT